MVEVLEAVKIAVEVFQAEEAEENVEDSTGVELST
jgi:hypothetical protein